MSAEEWQLLAMTDRHTSAAELAERLGCGEFDTSSLIVAMVERSLLVIDPPLTEDAPPSALDRAEDDPEETGGGDGGPVAGDEPIGADTEDSTTDDPATEALCERALCERPEDSASGDPVAEDSFPERFPIDDLLGDEGAAPGGRWSEESVEGSRLAAAQSFEPLGAEAFSGEGVPGVDQGVQVRTADAWDDVVAGFDPAEQRSTGPDPSTETSGDRSDAPAGTAHGADETADEVLRQMSRLSPKAAEAIAAALNTPATTAPEAEGPLDRSDGDGPMTYLGSF